MKDYEITEIKKELENIKTISELLLLTSDNRKLSSECAHGMSRILWDSCVAVESIVVDSLSKEF